VLENLSDDLDESDAHNVVSNLGGFNWEEFERKCQSASSAAPVKSTHASHPPYRPTRRTAEDDEQP
jgi:hypothetical protein